MVRKAGRRARAATVPTVDEAERLHHRVYVVRLEHPRHLDVPCYYVGMTGLSPEERFANHKAGIKGAGVVRRYGLELAYEWFDDIPPMTFADAALCEPTLADELRDRGFVVFGPTNRGASNDDAS